MTSPTYALSLRAFIACKSLVLRQLLLTTSTETRDRGALL